MDFTIFFNIVILISLLVVIYLFVKSKVVQVNYDRTSYNISTNVADKLKDYISYKFEEILSKDIFDFNLTSEEYDTSRDVKYKLKDSLKYSNYGSLSSKKFIKGLMFDLLENDYKIKLEDLNSIISFNSEENLTSKDKYDMIMYIYEKEYGADALNYVIQKYFLDTPKYVNSDAPSYIVTKEDIDNIFLNEVKVNDFSFEDKLNIVVQKIYEETNGYGAIDIIKYMQIDGISAGVSGMDQNFLDNISNVEKYISDIEQYVVRMSYDNVWIVYQGKSINLAFLSFGSYAELKRVCRNLCKHTGGILETYGYKINELPDGSKVMVFKPSFADTWSFFIKKHTYTKYIKTEELLPHKNSEMVNEFLKYIIRGARNIAITGEPNSGKTTFLTSIVKNIYPTMNIRVYENSFELHLRNIYPFYNILSIKETDKIPAKEALELQKYSNGNVSIIGELNNDEVASNMIQSAFVYNKFTIFTHYAKTFPLLLTSIRNSLLRTNMFTNENIALEQVVNVINFDIHLKKSAEGDRYIERITECIPKQEANGGYEYRNIIEFKKGKYIMLRNISEMNISEIRDNLNSEDRVTFDEFIDRVWG